MDKTKPAQSDSKALWGGRFSTGAAERLRDYTESVSFDWQLYRHDIAGSIAHAKMLAHIKVLTPSELKVIVDGLTEIRAQIDRGQFKWRTDLEDVHMNIEAELTARCPTGAKLHTGRSRNDQVATAMRLWLKDQIAANQGAIAALQTALETWASRDIKVVIPGYTHLQRAQPVLLAHHLLAYIEMLERDYERLADCLKRVDVLPLGSGAIAGSTLPLDREFVRKTLGFARVSDNSMDAVSDRDFIIEYSAACALLAVHLSRLAEDLILWSSAEFHFIRIGDAYTTGSSLMPQKKNPDIAELARGKTGRVIGNLVALLTLLKGLPMTYNRDLQEDKERMFDTAKTVQGALLIFAEMLGHIEVNTGACAPPPPIRFCSRPISPTGSCARASPSGTRIISSAKRLASPKRRRCRSPSSSSPSGRKSAPFSTKAPSKFSPSRKASPRAPRLARPTPSWCGNSFSAGKIF